MPLSQTTLKNLIAKSKNKNLIDGQEIELLMGDLRDEANSSILSYENKEEIKELVQYIDHKALRPYHKTCIFAKLLANEPPLSTEHLEKVLQYYDKQHLDEVSISIPRNGSGTIIHLATFLGRTDIIDSLVKKGANVNLLSTDHAAPIHLAKQKKDIEILIRGGADVNLKNKHGDTALNNAIRNRDTESAKFLIENPVVDINAKSANKASPIWLVGCGIYSSPESKEILRLLMEKGAKITMSEAQTSRNAKLVEYAARKGKNNTVKNLNFPFLLERAIDIGDAPGVKDLLDRGADLHYKGTSVGAFFESLIFGPDFSLEKRNRLFRAATTGNKLVVDVILDHIKNNGLVNYEQNEKLLKSCLKPLKDYLKELEGFLKDQGKKIANPNKGEEYIRRANEEITYGKKQIDIYKYIMGSISETLGSLRNKFAEANSDLNFANRSSSSNAQASSTVNASIHNSRKPKVGASSVAIDPEEELVLSENRYARETWEMSFAAHDEDDESRPLLPKTPLDSNQKTHFATPVTTNGVANLPRAKDSYVAKDRSGAGFRKTPSPSPDIVASSSGAINPPRGKTPSK